MKRPIEARFVERDTAGAYLQLPLDQAHLDLMMSFLDNCDRALAP